MKVGDKIRGKVIDKYVYCDRIHYIVAIESEYNKRIEITPDGLNPIIIVGDKILVEKVSDFTNEQNLKVTII